MLLTDKENQTPTHWLAWVELFFEEKNNIYIQNKWFNVLTSYLPSPNSRGSEKEWESKQVKNEYLQDTILQWNAVPVANIWPRITTWNENNADIINIHLFGC